MEFKNFKEFCKAIAEKMEYDFPEQKEELNRFNIKKGEFSIYLTKHPYSFGKLSVYGSYPGNCKNEYYAPKEEVCIHNYRDEGTIEFVVSRESSFDVKLTDVTLEQAKQIWNIIK